MKNEAEPIETEKSRGRKDLFRFFWAASFFFGLGIYLASTVAATMWLGHEFDEMFGTHPKGLIVGIAVGFPTAIYSIYKKVRREFGKK